MQNIEELQSNLGHIDLYLLDQILKSRYSINDRILEAGCGHGRNIALFHRFGFPIYGLDADAERVEYCQQLFPDMKERLLQADLLNIPFPNDYFDHIISSAVLHFSDSTTHFKSLFEEHGRVLRSGGSFFIRMTTAFGLDPQNKKALGAGKYRLPDETERFLLEYADLYELMEEHGFGLLEPIKTVNVHEMRAMGVIVLQKN